MIAGGDHETSEQRLIDLANPDAPPRLVAAREEGVQYSLADRGDELFILTNADGAIDFKIVTAPLASPERANWRDLIPHRAGRLCARCRALCRPSWCGWSAPTRCPRSSSAISTSGEEHAIAFDEAAYSLDTMGGYEFDTTNLRFSYSSMTTPSEVYDYDMATRDAHLAQAAGNSVRPQPGRLRHHAHHGDSRMTAREVPVSILHRQDLMRDGKAPLLLYGYGSYGMAMPASFNANRLSLVDRGFVYAIAHIRGGTDKGWGWYLDGKREKKTNTLRRFRRRARAR